MSTRSTKIPELDEHLGGGIKHSTIAVLWASPGIDNTVFAYHILKEALKEGDSCIYVSSSKDPSIVIKELSRQAINPQEYISKNRLILLDAHTRLVYADPTERFYVEDPRDVRSITKALKEALKSTGREHTLVVYDSVSTLIDHCGAGSILEFPVWRNLFSERNASGLFLFTEWPYEEYVLDLLELMSDSIIHLKPSSNIKTSEKYFTVYKKNNGEKTTKKTYIPYEATPEGIEIYKKTS